MSLVRPKQHQKPLVVCIGFLGSQPRHIAKYAQLLSSITVNVEPLEFQNDSPSATQPLEKAEHLAITSPDVIQYIPPLSSVLSMSGVEAAARRLGEKVERAIDSPAPISFPTPRRIARCLPDPVQITPQTILEDERHFLPRKIMFFCLSNNGAFGYANLLQHLQQHKPATFERVTAQTCGVIWDSSPSHPSKELFQRGFTSAIGTLFGLQPNPSNPIISPIVSLVSDILLSRQEYLFAQSQLVTTLDYLIPFHAPQLYLITEQDDMVLPHETRDFIENRSQRVSSFFGDFLQGSFEKLYLQVHPEETLQRAVSNAVNDKHKNRKQQDSTTSSTNLLDAASTLSVLASSSSSSSSSSAPPSSSSSSSPQSALSPQQKLRTEWQNPLYLQHQQCRMLYNHILNDFVQPYWQTKQHEQNLQTIKKSLDTTTVQPTNGQQTFNSSPFFGDNEHVNLSPQARTQIEQFRPVQGIFKPQLRKDMLLQVDDQHCTTISPLFTKTQQFHDDGRHFLFDFKDSAHVQHIRRHPEEYKELVQAFTYYVLRG